MMVGKYEYEIVRHGEGIFTVKRPARSSYEEVIREYAAQGWRLVQVFAPSVGASGASKYFDIIFEREVR